MKSDDKDDDEWLDKDNDDECPLLLDLPLSIFFLFSVSIM